MPELALIQDGAEVARQGRADIAGWLKEIAKAELGCSEVQVVTDHATSRLLDGLQPEDCRCLLLASNALLSGAVRRSVERHAEDLHRYLEAGGGLVVLHQLVGDLGPLLPDALAVQLGDRDFSLGSASADVFDPNDALLRYPLEVDQQLLADGQQRSGPRPLYWKSIRADSLSEQFKPVLVGAEGETLLTRTITRAQANIVISALPLDWQQCGELLVNALAYALRGKPLRVLLRSKADARDPMLEHWLREDGRTAQVDLEADNDRELNWLLSEVDLCIVTSTERPRALLDRPAFRDFIAQGGALVGVTPYAGEGVRQVEALIGGHLEAQLVGTFLFELYAVQRWQSVDFAFELRNVVSMLELLWPDYRRRSRLAVDPRELVAMRRDVAARLAAPEHREDFGSSLALAQILRIVTPADQDITTHLEWLKHGLENQVVAVRFQVMGQIACAMAGESRRGRWLGELANVWEQTPDDFASLADVARVLDSAAFVCRRTESPNEAEAIAVARLVCDRLSQEELQPGSGWLSDEGTADIVRGLVALLEAGAGNDEWVRGRVVDHVAVGTAALRRALPRYERNPRGLAWLARITEALLVADRCHPIGVGRLLALDWPAAPDGDVAREAGHEDALLVALAEGAKRGEELAAELAQIRRAATLGETVATTAGLLVIAAPLVGAVLVLKGSSVTDAVQAGAVALVAFLVLTVWVLTQLRRFNLLMPALDRPYQVMRGVVEKRIFG